MFHRCEKQEIATPDELICPLTQQIYLEPVTLPNGTTVESDIIKRWIVKNHTNPFTRERLCQRDLRWDMETSIKVKEFLSQHPEKAREQFDKGDFKPKAQRKLFFDDLVIEEPNEDNEQENECADQVGRLKI